MSSASFFASAGARGDRALRAVFILLLSLSVIANISHAATSTPTGVWTSVNPAGIDPTVNFGSQSVKVDPRRPSDFYATFDGQGVFKSTDYGINWTRVNTGTNGTAMNNSGGVSIADGGAGNPPILYSGNIHDPQGFWKSTDGGVSWTNYNIGPLASNRQDVYSPSVDPYDPQHLIMCGHEQDALVQSTDGGKTWTKIPMASGMASGGGTSFLFYIDTGSASTTRNTWLFISQQNTGTWRTTDGGNSWTQVDLNDHPHGASQIYQTSPGGPVFMAGVYSSLGWGVLRSADLGKTWTHVGNATGETAVFGTPNNVYALWGWAIGNGTNNIDPALEVAPQPAVTGWVSQPTPAGMHNGGVAEVAVSYNGTNYIIVEANWNGGLWRYVEPAGSASAMPQASLAASPTNITSTNTSMLTWSSANATACASTGGWTKSTATSGSAAVTPSSTTTYAMTCTGPQGTSAPATATVTVAATAAPTVSLSASATSISAGASSTLTWSSSNSSSCTASGGWTGTQATAGSLAVSPKATTTYTLACSGTGGTSSTPASVTVTVAAPVTIPPTTTGLSAKAGDAQVSLTWAASSGATSYHVKRSTTSGGSYTQVGAPTATSYVDTSVTNGTAYYYVVSAVDSAGESANSAQVTATPVSSTSSGGSSGSGSGTVSGSWSNVTPTNIDLTSNLSCGNYGTQSVQADRSHPTNAYTLFACQGIWKSSDYGRTWIGPINSGLNGAFLTDCAGAITVVPGSASSSPTLYASCMRGSGTGFWKSVNGGVDWTKIKLAQMSSGVGQQFTAPVVDPYDSKHLLMTGHAVNLLVESVDGGTTWTTVKTASGMSMTNGGTGGIAFVNTGSAASSRTTWLWLADQGGGSVGTWRTTNSGVSWTRVDKNEHISGALNWLYQPDTTGTMYMAGVYSGLGWGVLKSTNFGQTWTHAGASQREAIVFGTPNAIYSEYGSGQGAGQVVQPLLETASPSTGTWTSPGTPNAMSQGPAQAVILNDGSQNIILTANYNAGIWRYGETSTASGPSPTVQLSVTSPNITAGNSTTLNWSSTSATSCTASGGWSGQQPTAGIQVVSPTVTTTYTLTCAGTGGNSQPSSAVVTVAAKAVPTATLSASSTSITAGGSSTLTWSSTNSTACTASGGWTGTLATSGTKTVSPTSTTAYNLTCIGTQGVSSPASVTVSVAAVTTTPPPTATLSASPASIASGASSTLTWSSANATACTGSGGWSGALATSGTRAVSPSSTTSYSIACTNAKGTSASATASVTVTASTSGGGSGTGGGTGLNFTSAPALSGVTVVPNRRSVIIKVPAVANARDFRVLVQPSGVKANGDGTETVTGGTQFCAGVQQHQARTRFVADNVTQFPYYFFVNGGKDTPYDQTPQFYGPPPGAWSFHDLDTPPNLAIEVTGVTSAMTVTVEAMDRLCPFPGTIGRTHADILLSHTTGDNDNPGNPYIDASALTTFPIVTNAEVIARYGSLIINGQGWAGGPNVQANVPTAPPFAQPAPVNPPKILARATVSIAPQANSATPTSTFFDDFSNTADTFQTLPLPKWTYPRYNAGQKVMQNSKWTIYANGYTCCGPTAPDGNYGYADAYVENGVMNTILSDWSQGVFSEVSLFPRKAAHLNGSTYLHVTYEVPSFATARRYWAVSLCGSSTAGQTLDSSGALKEQVVHSIFFYGNTGASPSTAGWNCLQIFNREGNAYAFSNWESMHNIHGGRPPVPPNKGLYDLNDYIYNSIPSISDPSKVAAYTVHPESDVVVLVNKPIPAAGLPEKLGANDQVVQGQYTSPINVSPMQLDNPSSEVAWFYRVDSKGNPVAGILDDQQLVAPRTKYDLYIRNNRLIMYVNGQARLCNDFTTPSTTLNIADAAVGFHQVLYHSSGEFTERFVDPDRGAAYHYRYNSPWVDRRTWANIGFQENVAAPSDFDANTCFVHTSLGAENNEP
jgi:hypothetical protein